MKNTECICGFDWVSDVLTNGRGEVCLDCAILWDYAERLGVDLIEFEAVPHVDRPRWLSAKFNAIVLSGEYEIDPEGAKEIWLMLDQIEHDRKSSGDTQTSLR